MSIGITTLLLAFNFAFAQNAPEVATASGVVRGTQEGDIAVFKGIPYAAAPVGEFRWRPTQAVKPRKDVRDASKYCADCPQRQWPGSTAKTSEDCLFLNLWTPADATNKSKLPVMVWIHGTRHLIFVTYKHI